MFQDDINLMDGRHMGSILGHQRQQFEVKSWAVDLLGQRRPSGQTNNVLPVSESSHTSEKKRNAQVEWFSVLKNTLKTF